MVVDAPTPLSYKEPSSAPTSLDSSPGRRSRTSTTSAPPPYESSGAESPQLISDEKRHFSEDQPSLELSHQESNTPAKMKPVYAQEPPAFSRAPLVSTQGLMPFDPLNIVIEGSGRSLDKGFSLDVPPSVEETHPFVLRDIQSAEWMRFMQDLKNGTAMSSCAKQKTFIVPLALGLGPGAFFVSKAVKAQIRRKKQAYAVNLINAWNKNFFHARRTEVILMRGSRPLTTSLGSDKLFAPTRPHHDDLSWVSRSSHDSSSIASEQERSVGCCSQSKIPLRLVVVAL